MEWLSEHFNVSVRNYLNDPPNPAELTAVLKKMEKPIGDIIRSKEPLFQEQYAGKSLSDTEWISICCTHPILIERPVVIRGEKAWLGRPFELFVAQLAAEIKA